MPPQGPSLSGRPDRGFERCASCRCAVRRSESTGCDCEDRGGSQRPMEFQQALEAADALRPAVTILPLSSLGLLVLAGWPMRESNVGKLGSGCSLGDLKLDELNNDRSEHCKR